MPCCIIGAVTMKMISSTSITSTNGVTLISENGAVLAPASLRGHAQPACALRGSAGALAAQIVLELGGEQVDRGLSSRSRPMKTL